MRPAHDVTERECSTRNIYFNKYSYKLEVKEVEKTP